MYMYQGCQHSQLKYPVLIPKYPNFAPLIYPEISYKIVQTILIIGHYIAWGRCIKIDLHYKKNRRSVQKSRNVHKNRTESS